MIGKQLGPYRIELELGTGGMGNVYLAEAVEPCALPVGTRVALKVIHPHLLTEPGFYERFLREARIGQAVDHPNVVRCYDCNRADLDGTPHAYLVMEYVEGQTLGELRDELERVPEELCRHIGREVAKGLAAIHGAGAVHRDLKPENVLITPDQVVKVMDLGVARLADEAIRLSHTGAFVGSVLYASPEQFGGKDLDARADLFSLGVVLYELSCGAHPHPGDDFASVLAKVVEVKPRPLGERNPRLSAFYEELVHVLLEKDRARRFNSAEEFLRALTEGEESTWWGQRAETIRAATRRPLRRIRTPKDTAVYGREDELVSLRECFHRAKAGNGQVFLLEGEAGIGKSRLMDELLGRLQEDGEEFNCLYGSFPPGSAATARGGFSMAFGDHFGEAGSADHLSQVPLLRPAFDAVLRGEPAPAGSVALDPATLNTCLVHAARSLANERPTIILIDDLHFATDEARDSFTSLALAMPGHRVLLVGTTRAGVPEAWRANVTRLPHASDLVLDRLGPKDLAHLLADAFQSEQLAHDLGMKIALKSDGNPFFAFEIIRGLREGMFITQRADGTWVSTQVVKEIVIPSSVQDLVSARVAELAEEERDLLDVACCFGFEFDPGLIGEVLGLGRIPTLKLFGQIERTHRLVRSAGRNYSFDHHQVQEALYESLHVQMREEYHAALAEALEARTNSATGPVESLLGGLVVELCEHYLRGGRGGSALRYLENALAHLVSTFQNVAAVDLAERALAVEDLLTGDLRCKVLLRICGTNGPLDRLGHRARQEELARETEQLASEIGDASLRARATRHLGVVYWRLARYEEAEATLRRALDAVVAMGDAGDEAKVLGDLGLVHRVQARHAEAGECFERQRALFRELGDKVGEASACGNLAENCRPQGLFAKARECAMRQLALSREVGARYQESVAAGSLGSILGMEGELVAAQEYGELHLAISREVGNRLGEAYATGGLGNIFFSQGCMTSAREYLERTLALLREVGDRMGECYALHNLGYFWLEEGEIMRAQEYLADSLNLSEELGLKHIGALAHLTLGAFTSDRAVLEKARDEAVSIGVPGVETLARCELALLPGGDPEDALRAFTENGERLSADDRKEARLLLFKATGDSAHLREARLLVDAAVARVPDEIRESMLVNLRINREIMAAWDETGAGAAPQ